MTLRFDLDGRITVEYEELATYQMSFQRIMRELFEHGQQWIDYPDRTTIVLDYRKTVWRFSKKCPKHLLEPLYTGREYVPFLLWQHETKDLIMRENIRVALDSTAGKLRAMGNDDMAHDIARFVRTSDSLIESMTAHRFLQEKRISALIATVGILGFIVASLVVALIVLV